MEGFDRAKWGLPGPCPNGKVLEFFVGLGILRPASRRLRKFIEETRLGHITCKHGFWRWKDFETIHPLELLEKIDRDGGREMLTEMAEIRQYVQGIGIMPEKMKQRYARLVEKAHRVYRHAYFVGWEPLEELFTPPKNPTGMLRKPIGGLWLSPWGEYGPEWFEFMKEVGFDYRRPIWELNLDGLKVFRAGKEEPDWEELSLEHDLVYVRRWPSGWRSTYDVNSYILLRWPGKDRWLRIAEGKWIGRML